MFNLQALLAKAAGEDYLKNLDPLAISKSFYDNPHNASLGQAALSWRQAGAAMDRERYTIVNRESWQGAGAEEATQEERFLRENWVDRQAQGSLTTAALLEELIGVVAEMRSLVVAPQLIEENRAALKRYTAEITHLITENATGVNRSAEIAECENAIMQLNEQYEVQRQQNIEAMKYYASKAEKIAWELPKFTAPQPAKRATP